MPLSPGASVGSKDMPTLAMTPVKVGVGPSHSIAVVNGRKRGRERKRKKVAIVGRVSICLYLEKQG